MGTDTCLLILSAFIGDIDFSILTRMQKGPKSTIHRFQKYKRFIRDFNKSIKGYKEYKKNHCNAGNAKKTSTRVTKIAAMLEN